MFDASIAPSAAPAPTSVCSSSMNRMIFAFGLFDFLEDGLQTIFELAAIFRAGDHGAEIERDHALVLQALGHIACNDALRQTFDDGRLADARLADQHRIVFRAPRQDLDHAADFFIASDDRIELAAAPVPSDRAHSAPAPDICLRDSGR